MNQFVVPPALGVKGRSAGGTVVMAIKRLAWPMRPAASRNFHQEWQQANFFTSRIKMRFVCINRKRCLFALVDK